MRLKKLELYGFKSFAQRTEIVLGDGITGIVGPNGSGKSNIADAVRWVLGEQSAKSLRGASMSDVIFGGTQKRKPLNYCEVSLIFDNEDHTLPLDYAEVMVTRRVFRSGESEYLLNGSACRLKDVVDLFRDTGIGREGYSIIGQGRIDEILSRRGEDRRAVFEEAAGINKYRARKEEADRKLQRTLENLDRLEDIAEEMERQLKPLSQQAEAARSYIALSEELKVLDMNLFLHRSDRLNARLAELDAQLMEMDAALRETARALGEKTERRDALQDAAATLDGQISTARDTLLRCAEDVHTVQEERASLTARMEARQEKLQTLQADREAGQAQMEELRASMDDAGSRRESLEQALREAEAEQQRLQTEADQARATESEAEETLETHKNAMLQAINQMATLRNSQTRLSTMRSQMAQRLEEVERSLRELRDTERALTESEQQAAALKEQEERTRTELADAYQAEQRHLAELDAELIGVRQSAEELSASLQAQAERYRVLTEMTREMEGYNQSVRHAMQYAKRQGLTTVHGALAQLISVPAEYETAIDMVLGASLQHIVTEDEETAKEMIRYLRENRLGRATFLPMTSVRSKLLNDRERQVLRMPGCLGVASEQVQCVPAYRGIVENLLGRTVLAKDLDSGIPIMQACGHSFRLVTLAGDVMHSGGSMTGGSVQSRSVNLLGRQREVQELKERLTRGKEELEAAKADIAARQSAKNQAKEDSAKALETLHDQEIAVARETEHLEAAREELAHHRERMRQTEEAAEQLRTAMDDIDSQLEAVNETTDLGESDHQAMEEETARLQKVLTEARAVSAAAGDAAVKAAIALNEQRHLLEMHQRDHTRLAADQAQLERAQADRERQIAELEAQTGTEQAQLQGLEARQEMALLQQTRQEQAVRNLEQDRQGKQTELRDILQDIENLHRQESRDTDRRHRVELSRAKADADLHALQERIWNTYEITYAGAEEYRMTEGFQPSEADRRAAELQTSIRALGPVNPHAVEEYADLKARYEELQVQKTDLHKAEQDLRQVIDQLLKQMTTTFVDSFAKLQVYFSETFTRLFGGGKAELILADPDDPLNCGIEVNAQPPGKKLQLLSLLSGGERALTAIAILFAMLKLRPSPFCILDEIEAALDDANIGYYADYLQEYSRETQFVVITHRKGTMERCNQLYGVAMEEQGVSKMVSVSLQDYED